MRQSSEIFDLFGKGGEGAGRRGEEGGGGGRE
jgi:hypothetical protein